VVWQDEDVDVYKGVLESHVYIYNKWWSHFWGYAIP